MSGDEALYDLGADPWEEHDLAASAPMVKSDDSSMTLAVAMPCSGCRPLKSPSASSSRISMSRSASDSGFSFLPSSHTWMSCCSPSPPSILRMTC